MATKAERRKALEHMTPAKLIEFEKSFGGTWYTGSRGNEAAKIAALLAQAERNKSIGNLLDRGLGLGLDDEEAGHVEGPAVEAAQSSAQASGASAPAVWVSVVISLVALFVSVMALVVALGGRQPGS